MPLCDDAQLRTALAAGCFADVFDTLFARGGFARNYTEPHGESDCHRFLVEFETPHNDLLMQSVCACRLMELLPNPCHAILLLLPCRSDLPLSVNTWKLAQRCCMRVFDMEVLVRSMRIFCSKKGGVVWEEFKESAIHTRRTRQEWVRFAGDRCRDLFVLTSWCRECGRDPSSLPTGATMLEAITLEAQKEVRAMHASVLEKHEQALLREKARARELKHDGKKPPAARRAFGKRETESIMTSTETEKGVLVHVVRKLAQVLERRKIVRIGPDLAGIIGALSRAHPLIKWSLRAVAHKAAARCSTFVTERKLRRHHWDLRCSSALRRLEEMV